MWHTKKTLRWKITRLNEIHKFSVGHFLTICFDFKKTILKIENSISQPKYVKCEMSVGMKNRLLNWSLRLFFLFFCRELSKLNFLFHLKSITNLVTLRKCNSHIQYYKIYFSSSIKLQKINLNVCKEYIRPSARSKEKKARSATIKSRDLDALKFSSYFYRKFLNRI